MNGKKVRQIISLATCFLVMVAVAVNRDGKLLGHDLAASAEAAADTASTLATLPDGTLVVNTSSLAKGVQGFGGATPLEIHVKDGVIAQIVPLKNGETPEFFDRAMRELSPRWIGKTPAEASAAEVDAITGATLSSGALIGNVRAGAAYLSDNPAALPTAGGLGALLSPKLIASLVVVLMAAVLPLFVHNKRYHNVQLVLNVLVLGFWSGSFLSYSLMVGMLSGGVASIAVYLVPIVMLVLAFVYPLFGKKQHYCTHVCPLGSIQQLAGQVRKGKVKPGQSTIKALDYFRQILWAVLMLCMWSGVMFNLMDYELFSAFIFRSAPIVIVVAGAAFVVLSAFITRPYCRFVCPTGTLFKLSETSTDKR